MVPEPAGVELVDGVEAMLVDGLEAELDGLDTELAGEVVPMEEEVVKTDTDELVYGMMVLVEVPVRVM